MPKDQPKRSPSKKSEEKYTREQPAPQEYLTPKMMEAEEIKTLLSWKAPSRPFRKRDRSYYTTVTILVVLIVLSVVFWLHDYLLVGTIMAVAFVTYVLAFVPPGELTYKISTQGITIGEDFYFWHFLDSFWFKEKEGFKILHIQTALRFPAQLMLVLGSEDSEKIKKVVSRFLPFHEVPYKSLMEKWSDSLQKHFPLENTHR